MNPVLSLDLETLSLNPNAAIIQIGAVVFDKDKVEDYLSMYTNNPTFNIVVDWQGQEKTFGRHVCEKTTKWWNEQDSLLVDRLLNSPDLSFKPAIELFDTWLKEIIELNGIEECWVKGNRDGVWIEEAFKSIGLKFPISYRGIKCIRSVGTTVDVKQPVVKSAQQHHALSDALVQAMWVQQITERIESWRRATEGQHRLKAA